MNDNPTPIALHRCRFVDYSPSPITALAFPPLPLPTLRAKKAGKERERDRVQEYGTLVVGHANGNIDLLEWTGEDDELQARQAWQLRKTLPGPNPSKVDTLALAIRFPDIFPSSKVPSLSDLRLFSCGGGSELLEWDIARSCVRRTAPSQGGSIWSMAVNPGSTTLALGCEDGTIRLLSLVADTLEHLRRFDRVKGRLLCIAWGPPVPRQSKPAAAEKLDANDAESDDDDEEEWNDSWLVAGGSDSSLHKWDVRTGRPVDRMTTDKMKGERTLVWSVGVLADGTIVSGDSLGTVKFWDSITCTQTHSFSAHAADVLCLTIGPEGSTVFTSGVDQKIVQFNYVSGASEVSSSGKWVQSASRRVHSHDVRSLAMWPPHTPTPASYRRKPSPGSPYIAPVLVSGGLDMSITMIPALPAHVTTSNVAGRVINPIASSVATTFEDSYYRRIPYRATMCVARTARLVLCMYETGLRLWRVLDIPDASLVIDGMDSTTDPETRVGWENVLEMELNVHTNLISSALSDDGRWLVASDLYETKLFKLTTTPTGVVKANRIRSFTSLLQEQLAVAGSKEPPSTGGRKFVFTPDSTKMIMASASTSVVVVIDLGSNEPTILRQFEHHRKISSLSGRRVIRGTSRGPKTHASHRGGDHEDTDEMTNSGIPPSILQMAVSPDGQWLASSDEWCRTFIYNLDSIQYHTTIPSLPHPPNAMAFVPDKPQILFSVLPNNAMHVYDVETGEVPPWAHDLNSRIPQQIFSTPDPVLGIAFDPVESPRPIVNGDVTMTENSRKSPRSTSALPPTTILWGSSWLCKLKLDWLGQYSKQRKRRKSEAEKQNLPPVSDVRNSTSESRNLRVITHYRAILAMGFLKPHELVLVEQPLVNVLSKLPPAFFKPKYGRT
ncbi:WD40 repeat-like protein [Pisolithus thermaeus]|nr:WD40 repeat-like protein [Pisolithus croceorrhizus]KAI6159562.1 WD40 repeat-like protein [Pisolithus thermaeus]